MLRLVIILWWKTSYVHCQRAIEGNRLVSRDQLESGLINIQGKCYLKGTFCITPIGSILGKEIGPKCQLERSLRSADKTRFDVKGLKAEETLGECIETRLSYKC